MFYDKNFYYPMWQIHHNDCHYKIHIEIMELLAWVIS